VVFGPHETNLARRRSVSDRHVAYYRRRAAGGAGVIVVEEASVHPSDWPYERCPLASESAEGWAAVAAACRDEGALALAALGHAGGQGSSAYSQAPLWAPSRVPEVSTREVPKWMEASEIAEVVEAFGAAAALATAAGMDGVEVNAGQFSLVRQFLSGLTNHRQDEWGQDKTLFARQILEAVRAAVSPSTIVGLRLSCDEMAPWAGLVPSSAIEVAGSLSALVDYVTVVRGSIYTASATRPDGHTPPGFNIDLAGEVRSALPSTTKVVAQGSIVDVGQAEDVVAGGRADLVEMTRAQIADPDLVAKIQAGQPDRVRPCILCNQACQVRDVRNPIVSCVGEPRSGHEWEDPPTEQATTAPVDVLVVGAGPAGLECARVAAANGHRVQVADARARPGGMIRVAAAGSGRERLAALADWLEAECGRLGVGLQTGRSVTAEDIERFSGHVVLATGSVAGWRAYEVDPGAAVLSAADVLEEVNDGRDPLPRGPVAAWDPIGGPIAISIAELLAGRGRTVSLVTPDLIPGNELSRSGDLAPANTRLQAEGVALERRSLLRAVHSGHLTVEDRFSGERRDIAAVALVDCGYRLPDDRLWKACGETPTRVGDAVAPRSVYEAVLEGRRAALAVGASSLSRHSVPAP